MNYQTFKPRPELASIVKCHWILEVPGDLQAPKQRVIPDGCIEMCFILGEDIKRFVSEDEYILQPRTMVFGQITKPYYIQPTGYVDTFAVRFYPFGFANLINLPLSELADKETPLASLFDPEAIIELEQKIIKASSTEARINAVEQFLLNELSDKSTIDHIVSSTVEMLVQTKGNTPISSITEHLGSSRRNLERKFLAQVGTSPKQLGRIIRLQAALKMMLNESNESLTQIAYENEYYDQAHFIRDFKDFTGTNPKKYLSNEQMMLSSLIYSSE